MNFSIEELYSMYGQYDTLITMNFHYNSDAYKKFGGSLMGEIIYTKEQRENLEEVLKQNPIPRTDEKVRIMPSSVVELTAEQFEHAERFGIQASDIYEILSYNRPRENQFIGKDKKEIKNTVTININSNPREINQLSFGFLSSRAKRNEGLSPEEKYQWLGLARYFGEDISKEPYVVYNDNENAIRYYEIRAKYYALTINEDEAKEFAKLIANRYIEAEKLIRAEVERSGEKLEAVAQKYGEKLDNLKNAAHGFEEQIILFGEKLIYLDLERFLHIYARHVGETHIAVESFAGKTVFQYKYDDIIRIVKDVVESEKDSIRAHFKANPDKIFVRMGKRSIYYQGHYYRVEIEPSGRLLTFHPYNNNEERDADGDG
jgi:hypothetical protein